GARDVQASGAGSQRAREKAPRCIVSVRDTRGQSRRGFLTSVAGLLAASSPLVSSGDSAGPVVPSQKATLRGQDVGGGTVVFTDVTASAGLSRAINTSGSPD